jgi:hypothetical protein
MGNTKTIDAGAPDADPPEQLVGNGPSGKDFERVYASLEMPIMVRHLMHRFL